MLFYGGGIKCFHAHENYLINRKKIDDGEKKNSQSKISEMERGNWTQMCNVSLLVLGAWKGQRGQQDRQLRNRRNV